MTDFAPEILNTWGKGWRQTEVDGQYNFTPDHFDTEERVFINQKHFFPLLILRQEKSPLVSYSGKTCCLMYVYIVKQVPEINAGITPINKNLPKEKTLFVFSSNLSNRWFLLAQVLESRKVWLRQIVSTSA